MFLDVAEILIQLKTNFVKSGILTEGFKKDLHQILEKFNLTNYFEAFIGL